MSLLPNPREMLGCRRQPGQSPGLRTGSLPAPCWCSCWCPCSRGPVWVGRSSPGFPSLHLWYISAGFGGQEDPLVLEMSPATTVADPQGWGWTPHSWHLPEAMGCPRPSVGAPGRTPGPGPSSSTASPLCWTGPTGSPLTSMVSASGQGVHPTRGASCPTGSLSLIPPCSWFPRPKAKARLSVNTPLPPRELSSVFQLSSLPLVVSFLPEDQLEPPGRWEMCLVSAGLASSSCTRAWSPLRNHIPGESCSFQGNDLPNTAFNSSMRQALLMLDEQPSRCDPVWRSLAALPDALLPEAPWFLILIPFQVLSSGLCFLHLQLVISSLRQTQTTRWKCTKMLFKPSQALVWRCPGALQEP